MHSTLESKRASRRSSMKDRNSPKSSQASMTNVFKKSYAGELIIRKP